MFRIAIIICVLYSATTRANEFIGRTSRNYIASRDSWSSTRHDDSFRNEYTFSDPEWEKMWHLNRGQGQDMNVIEAWNEGFTGKGVVVSILDDGLEISHPDLSKNYDPLASYDYVSNDPDPTPDYSDSSNYQGTRCAGVVAAEANNSICGVGIAYEASIGGIRMLNSMNSTPLDKVEAASLSHNNQHIDIYSASWGPDDYGRTVDGPGELARNAIFHGVNKGRGGLGSIFVWASGTGGRWGDNCNCDGYVNSMYTISISTASERGTVPWYAEHCSPSLATTYSSDSWKANDRNITTTTIGEKCTSSFDGTSPAAPIAAGILALTLQANPTLTWRDVQHIIVRTSRSAPLTSQDWATNGAGLRYSNFFGFGLMDAGAMVKLARRWISVSERFVCQVPVIRIDSEETIARYGTLRRKFKLEGLNCPNVGHLEHVQLIVSTRSNQRGNLGMVIISPSGTISTVLTPRPRDIFGKSFINWPFMTVHFWGENPIGTWTLEFQNNGTFNQILSNVTFLGYGTLSNPNQGDSNFPSGLSNRDEIQDEKWPFYISFWTILEFSIIVFIIWQVVKWIGARRNENKFTKVQM